MHVCMCILGFVMLPHAAPYSWLQLPQRQSAQKTKNKKPEKQEHAVLVSAAVLLVCCCVPGLLLCAVCCAVLCHF